MTTVTAHNTNVYVGLAGESALIIGAEGTPLGEGGMYRLTEGQSALGFAIENGLPENPQVRALVAHPDRTGHRLRWHPRRRVPQRRPGRELATHRHPQRRRVVVGRAPQRLVNHVRRLRWWARVSVRRRRQHLASDEHRGAGPSTYHHEPA